MNEAKKEAAPLPVRSNVGLGTTVLRQIGSFVFEEVNGGREPIYALTKAGYLHQSGYGFLSPDRVIIVPNVELRGRAL